MPELKHYPAIRCIEKRIEELNQEIALAQKIIDNPEMMADCYFAKIDKDNFEKEISTLRKTIQTLIH